MEEINKLLEYIYIFFNKMRITKTIFFSNSKLMTLF